MKKNQILIKIFLIVVVLILMVFNFKLFSFYNGVVVVASDSDNVTNDISTMTSIQNIVYYNNPINFLQSEKSDFVAIISTDETSYLYYLDQDEIDVISIAGFFSDNLEPVKQNVVPLYVFPIVLLAIIVIPIGKRNNSK